jgi:hypothetical protein
MVESEATPSNCSSSQLVTYLIRLLGLFRDHRMLFRKINASLIERLQDQRTIIDLRLIVDVQRRITTVHRQFLRKYAKRHLSQTVYKTISELFDSILLNLEYLSSQF